MAGGRRRPSSSSSSLGTCQQQQEEEKPLGRAHAGRNYITVARPFVIICHTTAILNNPRQAYYDLLLSYDDDPPRFPS